MTKIIRKIIRFIVGVLAVPFVVIFSFLNWVFEIDAVDFSQWRKIITFKDL